MEIDPQVREQILDAAEGRFRHYGFAKTTMAELASDCAMSAGNLYRYFDSKEEIGVSIARRCMMTLDGICRDVIARTDIGPLRKLEVMIRAMADENRRRFECDTKLDELLSYMHAKRPETVKMFMDGLSHRIAEILVEGVSTGEITSEDPRETAIDIFHAGKGVVDPAIIMHMSEDEFERRIRGVTRLIIEGVRSR
ncbi:MAG TPA: TetR/AcrR family transcriptional regulator [Alphaproteobacteria bacterium]|nr:TetR/AcrR family transcriptional regulator [Alphaproteobacteria bacterium]